MIIVSGEVPQDPVVNRKTGQLFEKRIVLKYIADGGRDPTNGDAIAEEDLIEVKGMHIFNISAYDAYNYILL